MLCVKIAQLLLVCRYESSIAAPFSDSAGLVRLAKPLLPNGAPLKFTCAPGKPTLFNRAKADKAVICPAIAVASGILPPATALLNCWVRPAWTSGATTGLKQVGDAPGASRLDGAPPATKFAATRQLP